MRLWLTNRDVTVVAATPKTINVIADALTVELPNKFWIQKSSPWSDGTKKFYNKLTRKFAAGHLPYILDIARSLDIEYSIVDSRDPSTIVPSKPLLSVQDWISWLRESGFFVQPELAVIQHKALRAVYKQAQESLPWCRGGISLPTGSGKTVLSFLLTDSLPKPALYLINTRDLLLQSKDTYERLFPKSPGMIWMKTFEPSNHTTLGMMQTIAPRVRGTNTKNPDVRVLDYLQTVKTVVVDEAHAVADNSYWDILQATPNAGCRLALGGSLLKRPDLGDWFFLGGFGPILHHVPSQTLRQKGLLAKAKVFLLDILQPKSRYKYAAAEKQVIIRNEYRNMQAVSAALLAASKGWVTLLLVKKEEHGRQVQELFSSLGYDITFLNYRDPVEYRKAYLDSLRSGETSILIASSIFNVGVDVPSIRFIVRLDGGLSQIASTQIPGRGSRRKENHNEFYMLDFVDRTHKDFHRHSKARIKVYTEEGYDLEAIDDVEEIPFADLAKGIAQTN